MRVGRIRILSQQYAELKAFYTATSHDDVELAFAQQEGSTCLGSSATRLIISDVRVSLLKEMKKIEETIRQEVQ